MFYDRFHISRFVYLIQSTLQRSLQVAIDDGGVNIVGEILEPYSNQLGGVQKLLNLTVLLFQYLLTI